MIQGLDFNPSFDYGGEIGTLGYWELGHWDSQDIGNCL